MRRRRRACQARRADRPLVGGRGRVRPPRADRSLRKPRRRPPGCGRSAPVSLMADPAHPDLLSGQPELLGKPHRLAAAVGEQLGGLDLAHVRDASHGVMIAIEIDTSLCSRGQRFRPRRSRAAPNAAPAGWAYSGMIPLRASSDTHRPAARSEGLSLNNASHGGSKALSKPRQAALSTLTPRRSAASHRSMSLEASGRPSRIASSR